MKNIILCGGRGTRLGKHGVNTPKALIEIGGRPILWHLLKSYSYYGIDDFILCLGYLGDSIKRYFLEQQWLNSDFTLELEKAGNYRLHNSRAISEDWRITFAETGLDTNTGGRVNRVRKYIGDDETFCVTYGDGLSDIDLKELIKFHFDHGKIATLAAVHPHSSFGVIKLDDNSAVTQFEEKPVLKEWINGGFFVFNRRIFDYLDDECTLEREPLEKLATERELMAFQHHGFWKCMDTHKDNVEFNRLWDAGQAGWKKWSEPRR